MFTAAFPVCVLFCTDVSYVIGITYQTIDKSLISELLGGLQGMWFMEWCCLTSGWYWNSTNNYSLLCQRPAPISTQYTKHPTFPSQNSMNLPSRKWTPLVSDHNLFSLWQFYNFPLFLISCKWTRDTWSLCFFLFVFVSLWISLFSYTHIEALRVCKELSVTWNYMRRYLEVACNKFSSKK